MNEILEKAGVTWEEIQRAAERLLGVAFHTPVLRSRHFDESAGCYAFFKAENLQRSGSIRFRGVFNRIKAHVEKVHAKAVVAYSSGNHAQAVALTARLLDLRAILVLPHNASSPKVAAARGYGAEIELYDPQLQNPVEMARNLARNSGAFLVSPLPKALSIAGCATAVVEMLEEIHDMQVLVLPFAADDLLAGCAMAARRIIPGIQVYGVEPPHRSASSENLIPNLDVWGLIEGMLSVPEEEIVNTQLLILERMKQLVEPAGALAAAAVRCKKEDFSGKKIGILLSSGNADFHKLSIALAHHAYPQRIANKEVTHER
ncbi:MAG TPA: pyridoxal-phosphate dependent enzyme, partial [Acidobacteriota bacterium]|nr:pyridoxal-phosphate dependent enzyme [Acidobacteriota bacterium]